MAIFLGRWGVEQRVTSIHFPQLNGQAEAAVESAKRLIRTNTGAGSSLDAGKVLVVLLHYLNKPFPSVDNSPAQLAMGKQLHDGIPVHRHHYKVDIPWEKALWARECEATRQQTEYIGRQGT